MTSTKNSEGGYGILIQTERSKPFRRLTGWDQVYASEGEAKQAAARALSRDWYAVKVAWIDGDPFTG